MLITKIKKFIKKQDFEPTLPGLFLNPAYIARKNLLSNIRKYARHFLGGHLLDVGCGTKPYQKIFNVDLYMGLDIKGGGHDDNAKNADVYYDGKTIPFPDSSFDYVISIEVFEHIFEPDHFLDEIHRVLRPYGLVLLTVPFVWEEHEVPHDYGRYTSFGLNSLLSKKGFKVIENIKSGNYIDTLTQMFASYIYATFSTEHRYFKYLNILVTMLLCSPILISGLLLSKILPENQNLYLDNIILARKSFVLLGYHHDSP